MSATSPFRRDSEFTWSSTASPSEHEDAVEEDERWGRTDAEPTHEASPFAEATLGGTGNDDEFDFAAGDHEASHPIQTLYSLPRAVIEALSGGLPALGVTLAMAAGYRDVNQLTNILFYFRHPDRAGRKISADERALAAEWISIRDQIVKPTLKTASFDAPATPSPGSAVGASEDLSADRLVWPGVSREELAFMRAVYRQQAKLSKGDFVADIPRTSLASIEGRWARPAAAEALRGLLSEARAALALANPNAQIGLLSAYRPASQQFLIWQGRVASGGDPGSGFPFYYRQAIDKKEVDEGDFSAAAVEKVAKYMRGFIASPGYSNHQDGVAFDFGEGAVGKRLRKLHSKSWLHRWLEENGPRLHFEPLATEAWHWTYRAPKAHGEVTTEERWADEVVAPAGGGTKIAVPRVPLLAPHRGKPPDLVLGWNEMPGAPPVIDVAVHLHGFWFPNLSLKRDIMPVSGLDLTPLGEASGAGRTRPTLKVLPRGNDTGVKQKHGAYNAYTFPALVTKGGLPELVRFALERFAAETRRSVPQVGRLILTAHSGGGKALLQILQYHDPHQVHVYDALYWSPEPLVRWARKRIARDRAVLEASRAGSAAQHMATSGGALRVFYQGRYKGGTRPNSLALRDAIAGDLPPSLAAWYRVEASELDHFQIPRQHGWRVLADASADVPRATAEPRKSRSVRPRREAEKEWEEPAALHEAFDEADEHALFEQPFASVASEAWSDSEPKRLGEEENEDEWLAGHSEGAYREHDHGHADAFADRAELFVEREEEDEAFESVAGTFADFDETDEAGIESHEVEQGEAEEAEALAGATWFEDPGFEDENAATVSFPSGATLKTVVGQTGRGEEHYDPNGAGNPLLDTSSGVRSTRLSANFTAGELSRSGGTLFDRARIDPALVVALQRLREHVGKEVRVTSSYRPYLYNDTLYRKKHKKKPTLSRHSSGQAADVKIAGMTGLAIAKAAIDACGTEIGVGIGRDYAHVDVRGKWARWTYFGGGGPESARAIAEVDAYRKQRLARVRVSPRRPRQ